MKCAVERFVPDPKNHLTLQRSVYAFDCIVVTVSVFMI